MTTINVQKFKKQNHVYMHNIHTVENNAVRRRIIQQKDQFYVI